MLIIVVVSVQLTGRHDSGETHEQQELIRNRCVNTVFDTIRMHSSIIKIYLLFLDLRWHIYFFIVCIVIKGPFSYRFLSALIHCVPLAQKKGKPHEWQKKNSSRNTSHARHTYGLGASYYVIVRNRRNRNDRTMKTI